MKNTEHRTQNTKPYRLITKDILEWASEYEGPRFHALLCDPPYELNFMNKGWDNSGIVFKPDTWKALKQHMHPGAFCFAFSSTRTLHRMMVAIEDAGFVIHPMMALWNFANGFPKASNPAYQFDKMEGKKPKSNYVSNEGSKDNTRKFNKGLGGGKGGIKGSHIEPATENGSLWQGHRYGLQALKPAFEPIICFQKPYPKKIKPVVSMLSTGAGCLNVDNCRIGYEAGGSLATNPSMRKTINGGNGGHVISTEKERRVVVPNMQGRWPSNLLICHLPDCRCRVTKQIKSKGEEESVVTWKCVDGCPVNELDIQTGIRKSNARGETDRATNSIFKVSGKARAFNHGDTGTASRYYFQGSWELDIQERLETSIPLKYIAKPSNKEKNAGLDKRNIHPTVKPLRIAEYLAKLLLPPKGYKRRILVPFAGSGSEMIGARQAGWDRVVGIELLKEHTDIAKARLAYWEGRTLNAKKPEGDIKVTNTFKQETKQSTQKRKKKRK
jgi:site-specific DNA-methyltransferase (adenine-specific)